MVNASLLVLVLAMWQGQDLPTEMTYDKDAEILKKHDLLKKQPIEFPKSCTPENIALFQRSIERKTSPVVDAIGNGLLLIPELAFDEFVLLLRAINGEHSENNKGSITSRVLAVDVTSADGHLFSEFTTFFAEREIRFFAGFQNSYLYTPAVEMGSADVSWPDFLVEQRKVMFDVLKKTYFSKYKFRAEEHLHDTAFYLNEWQGVDFFVLPPLLGAYVYYRGLDKSFNLGGTYMHVLIEPAQRFISHGDVVGGIALEWRPYKSFPVGIIASMGMYDHSPEFEFIGIGTSIGAVQQAIVGKGQKLR